MASARVFPQTVGAADDPRLADYRTVRDPERRRQAGTFLVESALVVRRLLAASRFRVRSLLLTPAALTSLRDAVERSGAVYPVYVAAPAVLSEILGFKFHRGCLAVAERGPTLAADELATPAGARTLLIADGVADPENVGALFRTARALGASAMLLAPGCADPLYPKAIRASMGAALTLPFAPLPDWPAEVDRLRRLGYLVVALTPAGEVDVADAFADPARASRTALVVGGEGSGLGPTVLAAVDVGVRIAMAPGVDSLNVAVAAGIALHRLRRI